MDAGGRLKRLIAGGIAAVAVVALAAVLVPSFRDQFLWKHLAGPVVADALNQGTAVLNGVPAQRGYTAVSITVYALTLLYLLGVIVEAFKQFDIAFDETLVVSFTPFMVFGGLLRVVEDAALVPYPWNTLIVSPVIYFLLFGVGLLLLGASRYAAQQGWTASHHTALRIAGGGGAAALAVLLASAVRAYPTHGILLLLLGVPAAAILAGIGVQRALVRWKPSTFLDSHVGTAAVTAHLLDGAVTAVIVTVLGGTEKLPAPGLIMDAIHPAAFPAVKLGVVLAILGAVEKEEADTLTALAFLALVAVGLGPGTRNLARALVGV